MRAVLYKDAGGPEVVEVLEVADPKIGAGEVLIEVAAAGLNRADVMQRRGFYPPPEGASEIPGLEVSGRIVEIADGVDSELLGKDVVALLAGGGYAEKVAVDARHVLPIPENVDVVDAAGLIEVAATVYSNLRTEAGVQTGDTALIHGGTGGIGTFALQFLKAIGATSIVTVGSPEKVELAKQLHADHVINYKQEDFAERVQQFTDGRGVDIILDVVGASYLNSNIESLARNGRMVVIGLQGGRKAELNMGTMLSKRLRIIATTLRSQDADAKAKIIAGVGKEVWPLVAAGQIAPQIDRKFSLEQAREAHEYFDSGQHTGKVLLVTA